MHDCLCDEPGGMVQCGKNSKVQGQAHLRLSENDGERMKFDVCEIRETGMARLSAGDSISKRCRLL